MRLLAPILTFWLIQYFEEDTDVNIRHAYYYAAAIAFCTMYQVRKQAGGILCFIILFYAIHILYLVHTSFKPWFVCEEYLLIVGIIVNNFKTTPLVILRLNNYFCDKRRLYWHTHQYSSILNTNRQYPMAWWISSYYGTHINGSLESPVWYSIR